MNFIVWRALRDKIPTDTRVTRLGYSISPRCCCCGSPGVETVDHLFCDGSFAKELWKILCGPMGIAFSDIPYRQLMVNWWRCKVRNPVHTLIVRCLPVIASWELWSTRCKAKYDNVRINVRRSLSLILFSVTQLVNTKLQQFPLTPNWDDFIKLMRSTILFEKSIIVKWIRPTPQFVKLNFDGSCKDGNCGGGGVIRDKDSYLVFAYSLPLGTGTINWAEASALHYGINWCLSNGLQYISAESDSKLLVECVNGRYATPWRISKEVEELKEVMVHSKLTVKHCYRESNQVADKLASLSHILTHAQVFHDFADLPPQVRGLMNMNRWNMTVLRRFKLKKSNIAFEQP